MISRFSTALRVGALNLCIAKTILNFLFLVEITIKIQHFGASLVAQW